MKHIILHNWESKMNLLDFFYFCIPVV